MSTPNNAATAFFRKTIRTVFWVCLTVAGLVMVYLAAAVIGTVWTTNGTARAAAGGSNTIYVLSNGFHSDIALPVEAGRPPSGLPVSPDDLPGGLADTRYLIIGWGSQTAYTSLLALSDLTARIAFKALLFDRSVMHVLPYSGEFHGERVYRLDLDEVQYGRLVEFISRTFSTDANDNANLLMGITQGFGDVFYRAEPRFSLFYGCNAWTGQALRQAGVSIGRWTPFAQSIEWNMGRITGQTHFDSEM
ncbi:MAG: TIGR02117 family protein [Alphaproteobacteria bacterium]|nr:TIGR02117 family protein [Alphaproteobacteria bacterium]